MLSQTFVWYTTKNINYFYILGGLGMELTTREEIIWNDLIKWEEQFIQI